MFNIKTIQQNNINNNTNKNNSIVSNFENKKKERIFAVRNENGNESRKKHQQDSEFRNVD